MPCAPSPSGEGNGGCGGWVHSPACDGDFHRKTMEIGKGCIDAKKSCDEQFPNQLIDRTQLNLELVEM